MRFNILPLLHLVDKKRLEEEKPVCLGGCKGRDQALWVLRVVAGLLGARLGDISFQYPQNPFLARGVGLTLCTHGADVSD